MTNELFSAIEGGALAALNGDTGPDAERIRKELEKLSDSDVAELKRARISPAQWAELLLAGAALGKKLRDILRGARKLA